MFRGGKYSFLRLRGNVRIFSFNSYLLNDLMKSSKSREVLCNQIPKKEGIEVFCLGKGEFWGPGGTGIFFRS